MQANSSTPHSTNGTPVGAVDRVALSGAAIALAGGLALPFVEFRANRIVDGVFSRMWVAAGTWAWLLLVAALAAAVVAIARIPRRAPVLLALGAGGFSAWLVAVGVSAARLMPPGNDVPRVSLASGAWLVMLGFAIVWFQGDRSTSSRVLRVIAAIAVVAALVAAWFVGGLARLGIVLEYYAQSDSFWPLVIQHVGLSLGGTAIAVLLGVPLGIVASRVAAVRSAVIPAAGIVQTIPSLALYGLLIVPLGLLRLPTIGPLPALIALTLYALLPIVRNTFLGVSGVDPAVIDAGRGMGMRPAELLLRVEVPLALPLVLEGVRASLVMMVGITAVMAVTGAQTLGTLVFLGWGSVATDLVLLGALPMVLLSVVADQGMRAIELAVVSPGIRFQEGQA